MSTQTLRDKSVGIGSDEPDAVDQAKDPVDAPAHGAPGKQAAIRRLRPRLPKLPKTRDEDKAERGRIWALILRVLVLFADYLLVMVTAIAVIPSFGAWLHQQTGAGQESLNSDGRLGVWLVPLLFVTLLLAAGEFCMMRGMWHWSSRMIVAIKTGKPASASTDQPEVASAGSIREARLTSTSPAEKTAKSTTRTATKRKNTARQKGRR